MPRRMTVLGMLLAVLVTFAAAAGLAFAGDLALDLPVRIVPSEPAGLLPPITAEGRTGWACDAERHATAATLRDAALPAAP